jgi:hypothetical protein
MSRVYLLALDGTEASDREAHGEAFVAVRWAIFCDWAIFESEVV